MPLMETVSAFQGAAIATTSKSVRQCSLLQPRDLDGLFIRRLPEPQPVNVKSDKQQLEPGDVLVSLRGQPMRAAVLRPRELRSAVAGNTLAILRPDPNRLDPVFLAGVLGSGLLMERLRPCYVATTSGHSISLAELRRVELAIPDLRTQRAIAEVFTAAAEYEETAARLLARRRSLVRATLAELLGD